MNSVVSVRRNNSLFCTGRFRGRPLLLVECIQGTLGPINGFGLFHVYPFPFPPHWSQISFLACLVQLIDLE